MLLIHVHQFLDIECLEDLSPGPNMHRPIPPCLGSVSIYWPAHAECVLVSYMASDALSTLPCRIPRLEYVFSRTMSARLSHEKSGTLSISTISHTHIVRRKIPLLLPERMSMIHIEGTG